MKWIDMHCDTLSEIVKIKETDRNTAESLYRNHLCVDAESSDRRIPRHNSSHAM